MVPIKLKMPIMARYEDAATMPTLLSAQKGIKCWPTIPVDDKPQIINVEANIQNAGSFADLNKTFRLVKNAFFPSCLGGVNISFSPRGVSLKSYGQSFENNRNNSAEKKLPIIGITSAYRQSTTVVNQANKGTNNN